MKCKLLKKARFYSVFQFSSVFKGKVVEKTSSKGSTKNGTFF